MSRYCLLFFVFFLYNNWLQAQNKTIKSYYDVDRKQIKEEYRVNDKDSTILEGLYKTFYQNGKPKTVGFYTNNQATDYWEYFYQNGNLKMEGLINNFINEGHWIYYYENGQKSHEGHMEKGKKNGYWRYYFEDGKIKSEGYYKDNKLDGEWKYYHDEGALKASAMYNQGIGYYKEYYENGIVKSEGKIKHGKSDSTWRYYFPNGNIKAQGNESNGLKDGEWKFFYENGNPLSIGYYSKGETNGYWRYYYENGNVSSEGIEKSGQKEGEWKMFYSSGKAKGTGSFKDGNGPYTEYYDNGKPKLKGQFKKGMYDGKWEYFYEDGIKEGECLYFNGEGWYTGYYTDGNKKMEGMLNNGNKVGIWKLYKTDGTIAGYYRTYYDEEEQKNPSLKPNTNPDSLVLVKKESKKKNISASAKSKKPFKLKLYKPDPLVYKTFILSLEPLNIALGNNIPINLEYYYQQKWGLEFSLSYFRKPFFDAPSALPLRAVFQQGFGYGIRYKRYFCNPEFIGMPYIAGEFRSKNLNNSTRLIDTLAVEPKEWQVEVNENIYEFNLLLGDRFMRYFDNSGFTLDIYFGIGLGYKSYRRNYIPNTDVDQIFNQSINSDQWQFPFRFGISFGYSF